jgi:N-acetylglutamate synthase-like GNAT family acetyltransferase
MVEIVSYSNRFEAGVIDLILPIQREEFGFAVTVADQPDLREIPSFYQTGGGGFWLALDGSAVVGTIGLRDIGQGQGALRKMFVGATHRGGEHRVARRLLERLVGDARTAGISEVFLGTTERFLAAHRFYEKSGFTRVKEGDLPSAFPRMALDTRFYRMSLAGESSALLRAD